MADRPWKNSRMWREDGYRVFFNCGDVYLWHPDCPGIVHSLLIRSGAWMDIVELPRWKVTVVDDLVPRIRAQFDDVIAHCYCTTLVSGTCDFCGNHRRSSNG